MIKLNPNELIDNLEGNLIGKSFLGIGIGTDGVPIDLLRVHLLGNALDNYTILVADEFSSNRLVGESGLNDFDLQYALSNYLTTLKDFSNIWKNKAEIMFASEFMKNDEYQQILNQLKDEIKQKRLEERIDHILTERGRDLEERRNFAINELAVIEYLKLNYSMNVKIGPHSEKKYDEVMKILASDMNFLYLNTVHALTRSTDEPSPYTVDKISSVPNKRILVTDDPDTVEEKLALGTSKALKYFAILGALAGKTLGKECKSNEEILQTIDYDKLLTLAQSYTLDNIIAPLRRSEGVSIYKKTPMRHLYDNTFKAAKYKFQGRTPSLKDVIRPELDSITDQLLFLLSERAKLSFNSKLYSEGYPHLEEVGIHPKIVTDVYSPLLNIICSSNKEFRLDSITRSLDLELMSLLQRRINLGYNVAIAKLRMDKSVYDGKREQEVLQIAVQKGSKFNLAPEITKKAFQFIMDKTKDVQNIVISRYELDFV